MIKKNCHWELLIDFMSFQTCLTFLLMWNTKDILRPPPHIIGFNGVQICLFTSVLFFILFILFTMNSFWVNCLFKGIMKWTAFITCLYDWLGNVSSSLKFHSWYFWNLLWNKHDTSRLGFWRKHSQIERGGAKTAYFIFTLESPLLECSILWNFVFTATDYITSSFFQLIILVQHWFSTALPWRM